ncbi:MAG TPA: helix-turn-helix transcriptional regulator [Flavobacteriales bacterium]|nr:helix-turn-helix transcriptional regulator [Flavobacteriales bacterium]
MKLKSYTPCERLKPYVKSFTIHEELKGQAYTVLPDTSFVMGFQYKGNLSYFLNGEEVHLAPFGVTGLRDSFRVFKNSPGIGSVLVFFKEGGAASFFKRPLHELFMQSTSLENFMLRSELLLVEEQLQEAKTDLMKIRVVENFLISKIASGESEPDKLVMACLHHIHKTNGNIKITELMKHLHTSQSPLEKRFRKTIGTSPKKYASIVRIKHIVESFKAGNAVFDMAYEAGYYDHAHFIKHFKAFTGVTPEKFFKSLK